ncbi:uncharacterized protein [Dysidea avara]|uniref:uncharacterized protein n=1 Tax=Dysidea avara TaxID=196820 RepID=UPI00332DDC55
MDDSNNNNTNETYCYLFDEDENNVKCNAILGCRRVIAIISMLCTLSVIFLIILFKKYQIFTQRLIMYLSIAAFFQAIGYVMGDYRFNDDHLPGFCVLQGIWLTYFDWCSFLNVCCITFNVFWNAYFLKKSDQFEKFYIAISWGFPLFVCFLPFIESSYGPAGLWCWIRSTRNGKRHAPGFVMQFTLYYVPFLVLSVILVIVYVLIIWKLHDRSKRWRGTYDPNTESEKTSSKENAKQLYLFPWFYLCIFIFPFINRVRILSGLEDDDVDQGVRFFFWFFHSVTLPAHGTLYSVAFALDKSTMSKLNYSSIKAAALAWVHKTEVQEYPMNDKEPTEMYQRTETASPDISVPSPTGDSEMSDPSDKFVMKGTAPCVLLIAFCLAICLTRSSEASPQLYSCSLTIFNDSTRLREYDCNHNFDIADYGEKISSDGARGYLTNDPGCACETLERPYNDSTISWAGVIKYSKHNDCTIKHKVSRAYKAGYRIAILVESNDCPPHDPNNSSVIDLSNIPIIITTSSLGNDILHYSVPSSDYEYAARVLIEAVYIDFALLWIVFGVTVAITITSTICCFCVFFVFRGIASKFRRQGLSRWSLRKLPQRKYQKGKEAFETCAICLEEFDNGDTIRVLPCSHIYHSKCVDEWLMKWNRVCPICKRVILRNERGQDQPENREEGEEENEPSLVEPGSPVAVAADNSSDSNTVENVPLLVSFSSPAEGRTNRYGSVVENDNGQYQLESYASLDTTGQLRDLSDDSDSVSGSESDRSVTV